MTPTARTLKLLRQAGYLAEVVERRGRLKSHDGTLTNGTPKSLPDGITKAQSHRFQKVASVPATVFERELAKAKGRRELQAWLQAGGQFEVHGWNRRGVKRVSVSAGDLAEETIVAPPRRSRGRGRNQGLLF